MIGTSFWAHAFRPCALAIVLLSFFLRIWSLDARSVWFDEALEYWVARSPLTDILPAIRAAILHPPLYPLLLHFWMKLGTQEFMLRFLSAIFSVLAVAMLILIGKRWLGPLTGLIVGLLAAVSAPQVQYAQELVPYALMTFSLTLYLFALAYAFQTMTWQAWGLWTGTAILCAYSYYGAAIPVLGSILVSLIESIVVRQKRLIGYLTFSTIGIALAVLPLALMLFLFQQTRGPGGGRIGASFSTFPIELMNTVEISKRFVQFHLVGWEGRLRWSTIPEWAKWLPAVIACIAALIGSINSGPALRRLIAWFITGFGFYWVAGRFFAYPFGGVRHSLIMAPLLLLMIALGVKSVWRIHWLPGSLLLVWITALGLLTLPVSQEDIRSVARYLQKHRATNEPIYVYYGAVPAFGYAYGQDISVFVGEPRNLWYNVCWRGDPACPHRDAIFYGKWIRDKDPGTQIADIEQVLGVWPARLWLVFSHIHKDEDQRMTAQLILEKGFSITDSYRTEGAVVMRLER